MALDRCNLKHGNTLIHIAIDQGNQDIFTYVLTMLKVRDHLRQLDKEKFWNMFKLSRDALEYRNKYENTPLIFAAKRNQTTMFTQLVSVGC